MRIGDHPDFDHPKYWQFERNSGLPRGYFDKPPIISWSTAAVVAGVVVIVVTLIII
jgi:hypothetical protein